MYQANFTDHKQIFEKHGIAVISSGMILTGALEVLGGIVTIAGLIALWGYAGPLLMVLIAIIMVIQIIVIIVAALKVLAGVEKALDISNFDSGREFLFDGIIRGRLGISNGAIGVPERSPALWLKATTVLLKQNY